MRNSTPRAQRLRAILAGLVSVAIASVGAIAVTPAFAADPDLAELGTVTASAEQDDTDGFFPATNANDGNPATRWASGNGPDDVSAVFTATVTADLGQSAEVSGIDLLWEASYAVDYDVQTANVLPVDDTGWSTVEQVRGGDGGADVVTFDAPVTAQFVRVVMLTRAAATWEAPVLHYYGYSLFTFGVSGSLATPAVRLDDATASVTAGEDYTATLSLSAASETEQSVRVVTADGTAVAGEDYTAINEVVTIPAGETTASLTVSTVDTGPLGGAGDFTIALSEPSDGIVLAPRSSTLVRIAPVNVDTPDVGPQTVLYDFEAGVPEGFSTWGIAPAVTPTLATAADADEGDAVLTATVGGEPAEGDWFGFTRDLPATDWSAGDGFTFRFLGTGSGGTLSYELKNGNAVMFDRNVVDDTVGWRQVSVLFDDLRLKGDPDSPVRFDPSGSTGFAVTLSGLGAGEWRFDDVALFEQVVVLQDFEGDVTVDEAPPGVFTFSGAGGAVTADILTQERDGNAENHVLGGEYTVPGGGWAGFSDHRETSQEWSDFRGIRFWWYASQANNPASPTAGPDARIEIKDGGASAEVSEIWTATFKDNWGSSTSRWKLVEIPFSAFALAGFQPGTGETRNGELDLTTMWGYSISLPPDGTTRAWSIDQFELYGTASTAADVSVTTDRDVYLVDQGQTAVVQVGVETRSGDPLAAPVTVDWSTGTGIAEDGVHYTSGAGSLTFEAGAASGATQTVEVDTLVVSTGEESRSIPLVLETTTANPPAVEPQIVINAHDLPYLNPELPDEERIADLLNRMSLAEKAGQMAQAERIGLQGAAQITELALGSVLSGGGSVPTPNTPEAWADMIDGYQSQALATRLQIPLLYGADAVHGHSNVLGATIFPHNINLGAARDPALAGLASRLTAIETKSTGVNWAFAPCLCVSLDDRWGRGYESFGEDPSLVSLYARPTTVGLQGDDPTDITGADEVLASAKHWAGDGGTSYDASALDRGGYPIDQGVTQIDSMAEFTRVHVDPYLPSLDAGVGTIMPSYSAVREGDGPVIRMHENTALNTDLLKGELGFGGFLISDYEGIDKLPGGTYAEKVARSINSGIDMAMAPYNFADFIAAVETGVDSGAIAQERVDDAVRRILQQKFALGLFEQPFADRSLQSEFGGDAHRAVARDAAAKSQVLLKNDNLLPLAKDASVYVAGSNADDLGNQMGGWTIQWQGGSGDTTTGTSILEGMQQVAPDATFTFSEDASAPIDAASVGVVVVGETPYAEGVGDVGNNGKSLSLSAADRAAIDTVCGAVECVVLVVSGRAQLVTDLVDQVDALVASFLPGSEGAGVADVLFGDTSFSGRLPISWPASAEQVPVNVGDDVYEPLFAYGWSERTDSPRDRLESLVASLGEGAARDAIQALLDADVWVGDTIADPAAAFQLLADAASWFGGTGSGTVLAAVAPVAESGSDADLVVSLARDLAQDAVVSGTAVEGAQAILADAEHLLVIGDADGAVVLFASVLGLVIDPGPGTPGGPGAPGGPGTDPAGDGPGGLAWTGLEIWFAIALAIALLVAGAVIVLRRRAVRG